MDPKLINKFIYGEVPFENVDGVIFTHTHSDHCDPHAVEKFFARNPGCVFFAPDNCSVDRGRFTAGAFEIEFRMIRHMPLANGESVRTFVFLITGGGKTIYVTGDAKPKVGDHLEMLKGKHVDAAFWNPLYPGWSEMVDFMPSVGAVHNYFYHLPVDPEDRMGIFRKCMRCLERNKDALAGFVPLTEYSLAEIEV